MYGCMQGATEPDGLRPIKTYTVVVGRNDKLLECCSAEMF